MKDNGQTSMLELMIGAMLVLAIVIAIINSFNVAYSSAQSQDAFEEMKQRSDNALNVLITKQGFDKNRSGSWEDVSGIADVNQIGLARLPFLLSEAKIRKFRGWAEGNEYAALKEKLGLGNYDFSVTIYVPDNNMFGVFHIVQDSSNHQVFYQDMGQDPENGMYKTVLTLEKNVDLESGTILDGEYKNIFNAPAIVRMKVYEKQ